MEFVIKFKLQKKLNIIYNKFILLQTTKQKRI